MKKGSGAITGEDFHRMQQLELDMLVELDRVCRKHGIQYVITCGTLLGAVRHQGFIPWDDDVDVSMMREEYEKFKKVSHELDPAICFFQDHDTDPEYRWGYAKLRRTGTTYIRPGQEKMKCKTGVYIDILPADDIPMSSLGQILNDFYCFCLRKILWAEIGKDDRSIGGAERTIYKILSHIRPEWVFRRVDAMARKSRNDSPNPVRTYLLPSGAKELGMYSDGKNTLKLRYGSPKVWIATVQEFDFEGHKFFGSSYYDTYLRSRFGDYMQLPPEEKRVAKAPASIWEF
ncbi:MAG: LicD family protein [Lachnospiraceae bacterium]|nr:LicD family protein [Lachnospiraceae bacterium]